MGINETDECRLCGKHPTPVLGISTLQTTMGESEDPSTIKSKHHTNP